MSDDHIKRFGLSHRQSASRFNALSDLGPVVRDKDNAQPVLPPPKTAFIPHPRLAPPGMMGSRLANDASRFMEAKRLESREGRDFKPLHRQDGTPRGWER